jgi:hypothetical protein
MPVPGEYKLDHSGQGRLVTVVSFLSLTLLIAGGVLAAVADRRSAFERAGGVLVIGGLALVGAELPLFR